MPRVSVVIPCRNYAQYLPDAVCSVVAQTYRNWELIVVDDGSEDDTAAVTEQLIREFAHLDISLIRGPNGGVSHARNTGIKHARGDYILPLDADDVIADSMLERTVMLLDSTPTVDVAYGDMWVFGDQVETYTRAFPDYDFQLLLERQILFYCSLFRRHIWELVGGFSTELPAYEDWDFWINCGKHGFQMQRIAQPLFGVRHKPTGLHTEGLRRDQELRARITLRHPELYNEVTQRWAEAILAPDGDDDGRIPDEILSRSRELTQLTRAFMLMDKEVIRVREQLAQCGCEPSHG